MSRKRFDHLSFCLPDILPDEQFVHTDLIRARTVLERIDEAAQGAGAGQTIALTDTEASDVLQMIQSTTFAMRVAAQRGNPQFEDWVPVLQALENNHELCAQAYSKSDIEEFLDGEKLTDEEWATVRRRWNDSEWSACMSETLADIAWEVIKERSK